MCNVIITSKCTICVATLIVAIIGFALNIGVFEFIHPYETILNQRTLFYKHIITYASKFKRATNTSKAMHSSLTKRHRQGTNI